MENREITREPYRYGYQGQFSEKDLTTGMQEFELRLYDPRIGRWISPDPVVGAFDSPYVGMANQPHMRIDPDGGCPPPCILLQEVVIEATSTATARAISTAVLTTINVAGWYAKDFGKFLVREDGLLKETKKGFLGATTLAAGLTQEATGLSTYEPDPFTTKVGFGISLMVSGRMPTPGAMPRLITPNGVTVTVAPVVISLNAASVHSEGSTAY